MKPTLLQWLAESTVEVGGNPNGTSLKTTVECSYWTLERLFGEPNYNPEHMTGWVVSLYDDISEQSVPVTIYTPPSYTGKSTECGEWNVGARSPYDASRVARHITTAG